MQDNYSRSSDERTYRRATTGFVERDRPFLGTDLAKLAPSSPVIWPGSGWETCKQTGAWVRSSRGLDPHIDAQIMSSGDDTGQVCS